MQAVIPYRLFLHLQPNIRCKLHEPKTKQCKLHEPKIKKCKLQEPKIEQCKLHEPRIQQCISQEPKIKQWKLHEPKIKQTGAANDMKESCMSAGAWWHIGRVDAFRPEGRGFESRSSRHIGTLSKLLCCVNSGTGNTRAVVGSASE